MTTDESYMKEALKEARKGDLCEVADPFNEIVGDTRCATGAFSDDFQTACFRFKTKNLRRSF